jgi:hypothetical protein
MIDKPDPYVHEQQQHTDPEQEPEVDPHGHPIEHEVSAQDLEKGIEYGIDETTPEEEQLEGHPTPDRPTGRLTP